MRVLACSVTDAGAALARRLPFEHRHGDLVGTVAARWPDVDAFVLVCATGIAVRAVAPHLQDKSRDPAVVCLDDGGRWAVALAGGHRGGANRLAVDVAGLVGAQAVVTTATDGAGLPALDTLPGWTVEGDAAAVTRAWLDGAPPAVTVDPELASWPLPHGLVVTDGGDGRVRVTDRAVDDSRPGTAVLRPQSLVAGVGASSGADPDGLRALLLRALDDAGLHPSAVGAVATIEAKQDEGAVVVLADGLGVPLRIVSAVAVAGVPVPNPSPVVAAAVGTPSVAEASALLAAGPGAALVVEKRKSRDATVAVARRTRPQGHLAVVGLGPGEPSLRAPAATAAIRSADAVLGYRPYVDLVGDLIEAHHAVVRFPIGAEPERCEQALARAAYGERVALVCSGDAGVYAMASLVCELAPSHGDPPVTVVPGITAALAAAAVLGAPLGHDHASISLSDLLTPWTHIERRLRAVAEADMVVSLYNPRSQRRTAQLDQAMTLLARHRPPHTPVAVVRDVGRAGQRIVRTTIDRFEPAGVDMLCLVVVGSSTTRWIGERMVTPRGYGG
jgi:cobalt-precorrin 5A hydrolase/precorrin-3B C17-methyltransferase